MVGIFACDATISSERDCVVVRTTGFSKDCVCRRYPGKAGALIMSSKSILVHIHAYRDMGESYLHIDYHIMGAVDNAIAKILNPTTRLCDLKQGRVQLFVNVE